ncbi:MAG: iron chaperone [Coriobacteriia bacterium]
MGEDEKRPVKKVARKPAAPRTRAAQGDGEADVRAVIAAMSAPDRTLAERLHEIVRANAPVLTSRLWYGMPAYAKDGKVICFFQSARKFKTRYATLGFQHEAKLDDGRMWPVAYALTELTAAEETRIAELVKTAVS